jgi:hypothetical protein
MKPFKLITNIMLTTLLGILSAQTIYVDTNNGNDKNEGTHKSPVQTIGKAAEIANECENNGSIVIKIASGLYNLTDKVVFNKDKYTEKNRLIIEAAVLPTDSFWNHEKMPVIMSTSLNSKNFGFDCSIGINIEVNHVTIRGLLFIGNPNPNTSYYYAIGRSGKNLIDIEVTQCLFVGDSDIMPIQSGILAHGNRIKVTHCIFYKCKNSVVYYFANENKNIERFGSEMSNCIVYGSYESGIWTASPDKNFIFKQNIITNCKYAWVHNTDNKTKYTLEDCIITNNENYITSLDGEKWKFSPSDIIYSERNAIQNH